MNIAVIQHALRATSEEDALALGNAAADATDMGAEVVVFCPAPVLASSDGGDPVAMVLRAAGEERKDKVVYLNPAMAPEGAHVAQLPLLGKTALFIGDSCMDADEILRVSGEKPAVVVLVPNSENDLQAEAMLEFALGLSSSLAGLVILVDCAGAEPGDPGHGGSAIVLLGEVIAEALGDDSALEAEVSTPIEQPEPRELLPAVPPLLAARLAHHQGRKPDVDYPADLS